MPRHRGTLDFHEKRRARRRLYSPLTFIAFAFLIVVVGRGVWGMYQKSRLSKEALAQSEAAYAELLDRERFLDEELDRLSTTAGVEAEVRERFGVAKDGEEVIVVLSENEDESIEPEERGFWARVKEWFGRTNDDYVKGE